MNVRRILLAACALVAGSWLIWSGVKSYQISKRLAAEGKDTTAQVLDGTVQYRSRGANRYYLTVQFQTEAGQPAQRRVQVNRGEYLKDSPGRTVTLHYLPSDPAICAIGAPVATWTNNLSSGAFVLVSACVLLVLNRRLANTRVVAVKVVERVGALCESQFEYAPVNAREFGHLDLSWYDASQRWLEERGFGWLGDEENLTFRRTSKGNRTLLRTMLGRDGTWITYLYHFKPAGLAPALAANGFKILELQTQFANGTFVCTSNAEEAGKLDPPPGVDALRLPANSSLDAIVEAHAQRVSAALAANPGVAALRMGGLEDIHRAQNVLQGIKAAFRRDVGITKQELERLAGNRLGAQQIDALYSEVEKLHAEQNRKAA
jgi:hypothetical protein